MRGFIHVSWILRRANGSRPVVLTTEDPYGLWVPYTGSTTCHDSALGLVSRSTVGLFTGLFEASSLSFWSQWQVI